MQNKKPPLFALSGYHTQFLDLKRTANSLGILSKTECQHSLWQDYKPNLEYMVVYQNKKNLTVSLAFLLVLNTDIGKKICGWTVAVRL